MTGADIYMKTCKEKALEWNVSPRSVNDMCKKGRIQGAIKEKGSWLIPDDSPKPMDGRVSNGKFIKKNMVAKAEVKSLPIGISDYVRAQEEYYYVDKTLLIKEFLDKKPLVSLFTRPRRFGKTLNMDMLRVFFEISDKNTSKYFADKKIWQCGEEYRSHQGKYPVIFLTFKDVKFDTWDATIDKIRGLLQEEYGRHQELLNSDKLSQYEKEYFTKIISATANEVELTSSLERLSKMLASHYDKAPVIIIDEYDTPIQEGYSKDFYDEIMMEKILKEMDRFRENGREHMARFEITETSYAAIRENRSGILESLRIKNAKILLDDFGSGFSSFGMLQDYDFDILKIDMSFIRKIGENPKTKSIVHSIIGMAHEIGIKTVAEGVETEEQVSFLRQSGCDYIQGYYYSKPLPEEEFVEFLERADVE